MPVSEHEVAGGSSREEKSLKRKKTSVWNTLSQGCLELSHGTEGLVVLRSSQVRERPDREAGASDEIGSQS